MKHLRSLHKSVLKAIIRFSTALITVETDNHLAMKKQD